MILRSIAFAALIGVALWIGYVRTGQVLDRSKELQIQARLTGDFESWFKFAARERPRMILRFTIAVALIICAVVLAKVWSPR